MSAFGKCSDCGAVTRLFRKPETTMSQSEPSVCSRCKEERSQLFFGSRPNTAAADQEAI